MATPTSEELIEQGKDEEIVKEVEYHILELERLREQADVVKNAESEHKENLMARCTALGITAVRVEGHGSISKTDGSVRTSYSKDNLVKTMATNGVSVKKIKKIMHEAGTISVGKPSVTFRKEKVKD